MTSMAVVTNPKTIGASLQIHGVRKTFDGAVTALDGIDLDIGSGEFLAILGPSGCGKSTLLRLIARLDQQFEGSITAHDGLHSPASPREVNIAYVFQDAHLLPWRNVLKNIELPLELAGVERAQRIEASRQALELVGLADLADRFPNQLSGGQRMRVSLARAMVTNPRLLLLDEPFAALDEITRQKLDEQLRELWAAQRMTVIFVTHSTTEAVYLAERAVVMTRRPGRIIADLKIDLPAHRPALIRATPEFAGRTRAVYEALEKGGS